MERGRTAGDRRGAVIPATAQLFTTEPQRIRSVRITLLGKGEIAGAAPVRVVREWNHTSDDYDGTALDPRFGKDGVHKHARCATCGYSWRQCSSHMGCLRMPPGTALFNPAFDKQLQAVLSALAPQQPETQWAGALESGLLLAFHASQPARERALATIMRAPAAVRLRMLREHAAPRPRGRGETKKKRGVRWKLDYASGKAVATVSDGETSTVHRLDGGEVLMLLEALTPMDLQAMGVDGGVGGLTGLLFADMPVIPTPMRPTGVRDGRPAYHAWTHAINRVAGAAKKLASPLTAEARAKALASAQDAVTDMIDPSVLGLKGVSQGSGHKRAAAHQESMKESTEKKEGLIRGNVLGKRGNENARSVITPDPWLCHDEVGVPDIIADKLCVPEPVNPWSRARGGAVTARGPLRVLTEQHLVRLLATGESLPDGCTLMRPLCDGDYVLFGRQPTMSNMSMCGARVRRVQGWTVRMHPDNCPKYNADFDGDEMNVTVPGSAASEAEVRCLAAVGRSMLSEATARPVVGAHQDALLGVMLLTAPGVVLTRAEALRLAGAAHWPAGAHWRTGADALAAALVPLGAELLWNGAGGVRVQNCTLHGGPLTKAHVGASADSLVHCVARTRGCGAALALLDALSALANEYLRMRPLCMTGDDLLLAGASDAAPGEVGTADEAVVAARYEARVAAPIRAGAANAFTMMADTGIKGSRTNLNQMYGGVGQQTINGRPPPHVSLGRALPTLRPNDPSAAARGLVLRSLVDGLTPTESVFNAASSRVGLVVGRLEVPDSGYKQRRIAQRMKDCVIASDGSVRCGANIVQFCYGGDGGDPRQDVRLRISPGELAAARAEAAARADAELEAAVSAVESAGPGATIPLALEWILNAQPAQAGALDPRPNAAAADDALVRAATLELRPWQPSGLARAAILVRLRRSERKRLGLRGAALVGVLRRLVRDWDESRAPPGMAVGIFVATSLGPPATQGRLNAFYTAGMQGGGAETADEEAHALEGLLSASTPAQRGSFGMTLHTLEGSREAAAALAQEVRGLMLSELLASPPRVGCDDARSIALRDASAVLNPQPEGAGLVVLRLNRAAMDAARLTAHAVAARLGVGASAWPFEDDPFVLVHVKNASAAGRFAKAAPTLALRGLARVSRAWVLRADDGTYVVRTAGTDLVAALGMPGVNPRRCVSSSVRDACDALGAEAGVRAAEREIRRIVGETTVNRRHLSLFADFVMRTGSPLPFSRHGMRAAGDGPLARALYETPLATLTDAAVRGERDDLSSLLAQIFSGSLLRAGTGCFDVAFDTQAA